MAKFTYLGFYLFNIILVIIFFLYFQLLFNWHWQWVIVSYAMYFLHDWRIPSWAQAQNLNMETSDVLIVARNLALVVFVISLLIFAIAKLVRSKHGSLEKLEISIEERQAIERKKMKKAVLLIVGGWLTIIILSIIEKLIHGHAADYILVFVFFFFGGIHLLCYLVPYWIQGALTKANAVMVKATNDMVKKKEE